MTAAAHRASLSGDARAAIGCAVAVARARPRMIALFVAVLTGSNLLRFWIGLTGGSDDAPVVRAAGWLFLVCRTCVTLWLHVAALRLAADRATPWRAAFAVRGSQAGWFHLLALASVATFIIRLWLGAAAGGVFMPAALGPGTALGLGVGLAATYLIFLPLQPGFARVLLRDVPTSPGWSLAAIRGRYLHSFAVVMLIAYPPALARQIAFAGLNARDGGRSIAATAVLDGALSVVLMLLATAVYLMVFRRAERMA